MKTMQNLAPDPGESVESDVLSSIRQLLADDRVDAEPPPVAAPDPAMADGHEAALRRRLTGTLRPDTMAEGRVLEAIPADQFPTPRATADTAGNEGLHDLVLAARQALAVQQMPERLRLSTAQRVHPEVEVMFPPLGSPDPAVDADLNSVPETAEDEGIADMALGSEDVVGSEDAPDACDDAPHLFALDADEVADTPDIRDMIRTIIHQELEGELGGRLSRNLRQLLRRELAAAMAEMQSKPNDEAIWSLED